MTCLNDICYAWESPIYRLSPATPAATAYRTRAEGARSSDARRATVSISAAIWRLRNERNARARNFSEKVGHYLRATGWSYTGTCDDPPKMGMAAAVLSAARPPPAAGPPPGYHGVN